MNIRGSGWRRRTASAPSPGRAKAAGHREGLTGPRSPVIVAAVLAVFSLAGFAVLVLNGLNEQDPDPTGVAAAGARGESALKSGERDFYVDVRSSLSPLLNRAKQLSALLGEVEGGSTLAPAVDQLAHDWAEDFATARDLVGRLPTPSPASHEYGREARSLYQLGAAVYVESARAVPRLVAAGQSSERQEALKRVRRLQILGDRLLDAGTRLLDRAESGSDGVAVQRLPSEEVPDFREDGLEPGATPGGPRPVTPFGDQGKPVAPGKWASRHGAAVAGAIRLFGSSVPWLSAVGAAPAMEIRSAAEALEDLARGLGAEVPDSRVAAEGSHDLRLALLLAAESLRTLELGGGELQQAQRLRLLAERLWTLSGELLVSGGAGRPSLYRFPPSGLDPAVLDRGGAFNGHPPPLRPGEDPGKDVPGGLPELPKLAGTVIGAPALLRRRRASGSRVPVPTDNRGM